MEHHQIASKAWAAQLEQDQREHAALQQKIQSMQAELDSITDLSADPSAVRALTYSLAHTLAELHPTQHTWAVPSSVGSKTPQHTSSMAAPYAAAAQHTGFLSNMQRQLVALQQALDAERLAHAFTRAREEQGTDELLSVQQRLADTTRALAASQQDSMLLYSSALEQITLLRHQQHAADKAADRQAAIAAVLRQQLDSSNTCLQQQRQKTATALRQAAASGFVCARLQAELGSARTRCSHAEQQQHSLQLELQQARLERDQARGAIQDLHAQLQQANSAKTAAERALAAEQNGMAVAAGAAALATAQAERDAAQEQLQAVAQELGDCRDAMRSHRRAAANAAVITAAMQEQLDDISQELQQAQQVAAAASAKAHAADRAAASAAAGREQMLQQLLAAQADSSALRTQLERGVISQAPSADEEAMDCFVEVVFEPASTKALKAAHPTAMGTHQHLLDGRQPADSGNAARADSRALAALENWGSGSMASDAGGEGSEGSCCDSMGDDADVFFDCLFD
jgi:hypothetical protein